MEQPCSELWMMMWLKVMMWLKMMMWYDGVTETNSQEVRSMVWEERTVSLLISLTVSRRCTFCLGATRKSQILHRIESRWLQFLWSCIVCCKMQTNLQACCSWWRKWKQEKRSRLRLQSNTKNRQILLWEWTLNNALLCIVQGLCALNLVFKCKRTRALHVSRVDKQQSIFQRKWTEGGQVGFKRTTTLPCLLSA